MADVKAPKSWKKWTDGQPRHNVGMIQKDVYAALGKNRFKARGALRVVKAAYKANMGVFAWLSQLGSGDISGVQKKRMLKELTAQRKRFGVYMKALRTLKPGDDIPVSMAPLVAKVSGERYFTPEFLLPYTVENQIDILAEDMAGRQSLMALLVAEAVKLPGRVKKAVEEGIEKAKDVLSTGAKWGIGLGVVGILGLGTVAVISRRR